MLLHGTLVGTVPVAVPEHGAVPVMPVQVDFVALESSEFPVEKIRFAASSIAGPAPDIQIVSRKKLVGELACLSSSWFAPNAERAAPVHPNPKSQPRAGKSQKLVKAA